MTEFLGMTSLRIGTTINSLPIILGNFFSMVLTENSIYCEFMRKGFNGLIFNCIEKALHSLGESVASAFFYQIENKFRFPKEEFASKPIEFIKCLKELLGVSGSATIERLM